MKIKVFLSKDGERYGRLDDGTQIGPLKAGSKNVYLGRIEYMFAGRQYYEPLPEPDEEEPEPKGNWGLPGT